MKLLVFLLVFLLSLNVYAGISITGTIIDSEDKQGIENVSVTLSTSDSTTVNQTMTLKGGHFKLNIPTSGEYFFTISSIGYKTTIVNIKNIQENMDIGTIELSLSAHMLDDVVVKAKSYTKVDRQMIFPSAENIYHSSSGVDVLSKLMLPGIAINPITNAITSLSNQQVQLRINDVIVTTNELLTIDPKDILRIEHIDQPSAKYGDAGDVINFILKKKEKGFSQGGNLLTGINSPYLNDMLYLKYNNKQSEFGLTYNYYFSDLTKNYRNDFQTLHFPSEVVDIKRIGLKSPTKFLDHRITLSYNWNNDKNAMFNLIFRNNWDRPNTTTKQSIDDELLNERYDSYLRTKDRIYTPSLDLYFQYLIDKKQSITSNVVLTHISTDYQRINKFFEGKDVISNFSYDSDGKKYSLVSEVNYTNKFEDYLGLSTGVKYSQAYTENTYMQDAKRTVNGMNTSDVYLYTQLEGQLGKFGYQGGVGLSRQYFHQSDGKYTYYKFRPSLSLSYSMKDNMTLRYHFSIRPAIPSLSDLSNFERWANQYEVVIGNPNLKPFSLYFNSMSYNYRKDRLSLFATMYHQYNKKPVMSEVLRLEDNGHYYFAYTNTNQKAFHHLQAIINMKYEIVRKKLMISITGGINRYLNLGNNYTHNYTGYIRRVELEGNHKNWSFSASYKMKSKALFQETFVIWDASSNFAIRYKYRSFQYGAEVMNLFLPYGGTSSQKSISDLVQKETAIHTKEYGNFVRLRVAWNLNFGRKYNSKQKTMYNSDNESGIMK